MNNLQTTIDKGLAYLKSQQLHDGSFPSYSSAYKDDFSGATVLSSTFLTSQILSTLAVHPKSDTSSIAVPASNFLLDQSSKAWTWNYWTRGSEISQILPYADDLDDTFCALSALYLYDSSLFTGDVLARVMVLLTETEVSEGGPYRTWAVTEESDAAWKDVDLAVNSNIAYFLSLLKVELPSLQTLQEDHVLQNSYLSPYYPSEIPVLYFVSRSYKGRYKEKIIAKINELRSKGGSWGNSLYTALALRSLYFLGVDRSTLKEGLFKLVNDQRQDGSWEPYAFCHDPARENREFYAGSAALTTAFCLEALQILLDIDNSKHKSDEFAEAVCDQVRVSYFERANMLGPELRRETENLYEKLLLADSERNCILMPYTFWGSLRSDVRESIPASFLAQAGLANLYGWIGCSLLDNVLDQDSEPEQGALLAFALREMVVQYRPLFEPYAALFDTVMDQMDSANQWEITHCRGLGTMYSLPDFSMYEMVSLKSIGHALGPLAVMLKAGFTPESEEVRQVLAFFRHYLAARQLNDDAHDWEEDLASGKLTAVVCMLLRKWPGTSSGKTLPVNNYEMEKFFWEHIVTEACQAILDQISLAEAELQAMEFLEHKEGLSQLLNGVKGAAHTALSEREKTKDFLNQLAH